MTVLGSRTARVVLGCAVLSGLSFLACGDDEKPSGPGPGASGEELFRALENDLLDTCGGTNGRCHIDGTFQKAPRWLGGADPYVTAKGYRGILPATKEVGDSIILTQVAHAGPALRSAKNNLFQRVADWLFVEVPGPPLPNTGAFSVRTGPNVIPLDTVGDGSAAGGRLAFLATENNGVLNLTAMKVIAPGNKNIRIVAPFFVILPRSGKVNADPTANGFQGELTVNAGTTVDLFAGSLILLRWDTAGQLKIVFNEVSSTPGQGVGVDCFALDQFVSSAVPAMRQPIDITADDGMDAGGGTIGQNSCIGCHSAEPPAGEAIGPAVSQMDLRGVDVDPANACRQARNWINFADKPSSTILRNPQGTANPSHPVVPLAESHPVVQGIKAWVDAERER